MRKERKYLIETFLGDKFQNELKLKHYKAGKTYKQKLNYYKKDFIKSLRSCKKIQDYNKTLGKAYDLFPVSKKYLDDLCIDVKRNINIINQIFEDIKKVNNLAIKNHKSALREIDNLLNKYKAVTVYTGSMNDCIPLYRGRLKKTFNTPSEMNNIEQYYHKPLNVSFISEERFNRCGDSMLYLGSSVVDIEKELNAKANDLALSCFLPNYSNFYYSKNIYDMFYEMVDTSLLFSLERSGAKFSWFQKGIHPSSSTITKMLFLIIFKHVITFPVENKKAKNEYKLPQLLSDWAKSKGYSGIRYLSAKDFSDYKPLESGTGINYNYVFFTDKNNMNSKGYDMKLINSFYSYLPTINTPNYTIYENELNIMEQKCKASSQNNNDYLLPAIQGKNFYEKRSQIKKNNMNYYSTNAGQEELKLLIEMIKDMNTKIK